jgi:hypothetical protein
LYIPAMKTVCGKLPKKTSGLRLRDKGLLAGLAGTRRVAAGSGLREETSRTDGLHGLLDVRFAGSRVICA